MALASCILLLRVWVVVGVLPLRDVDELAHHVRYALRGNGNATQLAVSSQR